jgi:hypothetical protein
MVAFNNFSRLFSANKSQNRVSAKDGIFSVPCPSAAPQPHFPLIQRFEKRLKVRFYHKLQQENENDKKCSCRNNTA